MDDQDRQNNRTSQPEAGGPLGLGSDIHSRYGVDPGVARSTSGFGLGESLSRFAAGHFALIRDIQQRWTIEDGQSHGSPLLDRRWSAGRSPFGAKMNAGAAGPSSRSMNARVAGEPEPAREIGGPLHQNPGGPEAPPRASLASNAAAIVSRKEASLNWSPASPSANPAQLQGQTDISWQPAAAGAVRVSPRTTSGGARRQNSSAEREPSSGDRPHNDLGPETVSHAASPVSLVQPPILSRAARKSALLQRQRATESSASRPGAAPGVERGTFDTSNDANDSRRDSSRTESFESGSETEGTTTARRSSESKASVGQGLSGGVDLEQSTPAVVDRVIFDSGSGSVLLGGALNGLQAPMMPTLLLPESGPLPNAIEALPPVTGTTVAAAEQASIRRPVVQQVLRRGNDPAGAQEPVERHPETPKRVAVPTARHPTEAAETPVIQRVLQQENESDRNENPTSVAPGSIGGQAVGTSRSALGSRFETEAAVVAETVVPTRITPGRIDVLHGSVGEFSAKSNAESDRQTPAPVSATPNSGDGMIVRRTRIESAPFETKAVDGGAIQITASKGAANVEPVLKPSIGPSVEARGEGAARQIVAEAPSEMPPARLPEQKASVIELPSAVEALPSQIHVSAPKVKRDQITASKGAADVGPVLKPSIGPSVEVRGEGAARQIAAEAPSETPPPRLPEQEASVIELPSAVKALPSQIHVSAPKVKRDQIGVSSGSLPESEIETAVPQLRPVSSGSSVLHRSPSTPVNAAEGDGHRLAVGVPPNPPIVRPPQTEGPSPLVPVHRVSGVMGGHTAISPDLFGGAATYGVGSAAGDASRDGLMAFSPSSPFPAGSDNRSQGLIGSAGSIQAIRPISRPIVVQRSPAAPTAAPTAPAIQAPGASPGGDGGSAGAPAVNITQLANRVYELLVKRLASERQRRGA